MSSTCGSRAIVDKKCEYPNSYIVVTENGHSYRRNRRDLLKTNEYGPISHTQFPGDDLPDFTETDKPPSIISIPTHPTVITVPQTGTPATQLPPRRSTREHRKPPRLSEYAT